MKNLSIMRSTMDPTHFALPYGLTNSGDQQSGNFRTNKPIGSCIRMPLCKLTNYCNNCRTFGKTVNQGVDEKKEIHESKRQREIESVGPHLAKTGLLVGTFLLELKPPDLRLVQGWTK